VGSWRHYCLVILKKVVARSTPFMIPIFNHCNPPFLFCLLYRARRQIAVISNGDFVARSVGGFQHDAAITRHLKGVAPRRPVSGERAISHGEQGIASQFAAYAHRASAVAGVGKVMALPRREAVLLVHQVRMPESHAVVSRDDRAVTKGNVLVSAGKAGLPQRDCFAA